MIFRKFLLLILLINLACLSAFAQNNTGQQFLEEANVQRKAKNYEQARHLYQAAIPLLESDKNWDAYYKANVFLIECLTRARKFDEAEVLLNKTINHHKANQKANKALLDLYNKYAVLFYYQDDYDQAIHWYKVAVETAERVYPPSHPNLATPYYKLALFQEIVGDNNAALAIFKKSANIQQENNDNYETANCYTRIASNYLALGDLKLAQRYSEQSIDLLKKEAILDYKMIAEQYNTLGVIFRDLQQFDLAKKNFQAALNLYKRPDVNFLNGVTNGYNNLGLFFLDQEIQLDSALYYFKRSLAVNQRLDQQGSRKNYIMQNWINMGVAARLQGQYPKAIQYSLKALALSQEDEIQFSEENSKIYQNLGETASQQGQYQEALQYFQQAISCHLPGYKPTDPFSNPSLDKMGVIGIHSLLLEHLNYKGQAFAKMAVKNNNTQELHKKSLECYIQADLLIDKMRQQQDVKDSKLFWVKTTHPIYEQAINRCLSLAELSSDQQYLTQAFYFIEKSKSVLLLESFKDNKAKRFAGLSPELQEKETDIKEKLLTAEQKFFQMQQANVSKEELKTIKQEVFELQQTSIALNKELEENHPSYYRMKYETEPVSLAKIQASLSSDQAMLQYFVGDKKLHLLLITTDSITTYSQENPADLTANIETFRNSIFGYFLDSEQDYEQSAALYSQLAFSLYQQLIPPVALPKKLIVVPDGVLGYLPFDALLAQKPTKPTKFKSHAYLLKKHQFSYLYSATFHEEINHNRPKASKGLLAFAPSFPETDQPIPIASRGKLGPLFSNKKEVKQICTLVGGNSLIGNEATEAQFYAKGPNFQILHFATHGKANDENPDYSYLAFTEIADAVENEFLYVHDLYNMQLTADLAVLSACETGVGKLYHGEGIASLARGFAYAGVPSIVTTLWSVNDEKTSDIMTLFYGQMKEGKPKDEALQAARLVYLSQNDHNHAHPFFWAAPIIIGNTAPLIFKRNFLYRYGWLIGLVLVLGGLVVWRQLK